MSIKLKALIFLITINILAVVFVVLFFAIKFSKESEITPSISAINSITSTD